MGQPIFVPLFISLEQRATHFFRKRLALMVGNVVLEKKAGSDGEGVYFDKKAESDGGGTCFLGQ